MTEENKEVSAGKTKKVSKRLAAAFKLPKVFAEFRKEKDFTITLQSGKTLTLTCELPGSFEMSWAMTRAINESDNSTMGVTFAYVPRIFAATLRKVNGRTIADMLAMEESEMRELLNPLFIKDMDEYRRSIVYQHIYESITGKIPYELLEPLYDQEMLVWIESVGGEKPLPANMIATPDSEEDEASSDKENSPSVTPNE